MYISVHSIKSFGIWPHADRQTDRHTHASCNAVTLVWGSLRLAPTNRARLTACEVSILSREASITTLEIPPTPAY